MIPKLQPRPPLRLGPRHDVSTSAATKACEATRCDPLEPLANLSLSHDGSLLVPSPPRTPTTPPLATRKGPAVAQKDSGGARSSFSLGSGFRSWRSLPSPLGGGNRSISNTNPEEASSSPAVPDRVAADDYDPETSMDWCPTSPPVTTTTTATTTSRPAYSTGTAFDGSPSTARLSCAGTNHVTFARQRFVPPDTRQPTGLEGMFERVVAVRDTAEATPSGTGRDVEMKSVTPREGSGSRAWLLAGWWK